MNDKAMMNQIYKDFFETKRKNDVEKIDEKVDYNIDELFIDDESKELLKKIIIYMEKSSLNEENNYINFNITLECNDQNTINQISEMLKYYGNKYNYIEGNDINNVSLYKLDEFDCNYYTNNSVVVFKDLDALKMNDINFIKKFTYNFKNNLNNKKITILVGNKNSIKEFLYNDEELIKNYFLFNIVAVKPDVNDIYNNIINKINVTDDFNIKLLDYISNTFNKSDVDYNTYESNLINYISFNKDLPKIDTIKPIEEIFKELNELVGLEKVKKTLHDLVDLINLKDKTKDELKINNVNLHMVFLGNPGTGKTTVARLISEILFNLKYIRENKLIEVSSKDLVAEYVGQTAVKTMNVVNKAMGGILFIDEAYALATKNNDNSFNGECIATLIKAMEDYRNDLIVIFAGYTKEMQDFLDSNSGIISRIGYVLEFDDYTNEELKNIFKGMTNKSGFILEDGVLDKLDEVIDLNRDSKNFGNARFIRNVFEKTIINHASNTKNIKSKKILKTITVKDIKY